ncbi:hypothetical protein WA026_019170 [Henosepilachna vigintioctopunctata]|uniref:Uncharacterized protein n=1 Tax=Henosepilachna vigintioctopunctata TaxID=420089 RepID=A0AAW1V2D7_9CUCU
MIYPITKVDLVNVKNEIVNEVSSAFLNEILSLKSLILSQSKQISDLKKEIRILTKCKNTTTTTAGPDITEVPADRNSTAESSKPDEQANLDAPNISSEIKNVTEIAENNFKENRVNTSENSSEWMVVTSKRRNNIKQAVPIADKPQVHLTSKRMDFNIDVLTDSRDSRELISLLEIYNVGVSCNSTTRPSSGACLDNIISNMKACLKIRELHISDHVALNFVLDNVPLTIPLNDKLTIRCIGEHTIDQFISSLSSVSWNDIYDMTKDVNKMWTLFSNRYRMIFEVSFPLKEISPRRNILTFRSSPDLQSKKKLLDNLLVISTVRPEFKNIYSNYKRIYDRAISSANRTFLSKYIENSNNKSKAV